MLTCNKVWLIEERKQQITQNKLCICIQINEKSTKK